MSALYTRLHQIPMFHGGQLLSQLRSIVRVDLDSMDPAAAQRHEQYTFTDMTSNQAIVNNQATYPENKTLVLDAIEYVRTLHRGPAVSAVEVGDRLREALDVVSLIWDAQTVRMAKLVYPHLTGKVHAQTSPSVSNDTQKTIVHARRIVNLFEAHGIPSARVCIKIPATPAGITACRVLSSPSPDVPAINTLATCVFSLPQARAAAQAGCTYAAPYFNELRVHFDETTWVKYDNPVREHPMSPVIASIVAALKGSNTLVMPASIKNVPEVLALVALRPDHITISAPLLDELAVLPALPEADLAHVTSEVTDELEHTDFLANDGAALASALINDPDVERRIQDAINLFADCELQAMEYVRSGAQTSGVKWDGEALWY
ncbi:hypothetical protein DXG01_014803 [Tephrocybe rancida]|nr:hypothetical protein DXG01_014803 [Tephrocybe rancida]